MGQVVPADALPSPPTARRGGLAGGRGHALHPEIGRGSRDGRDPFPGAVPLQFVGNGAHVAGLYHVTETQSVVYILCVWPYVYI